ERLGSGHSFSCYDEHSDDVSNSLQIFGQWIMNTAKSDDIDNKKKLLTWLSSSLKTFTEEKKHVTPLISPIILKTFLKLNSLDANKLEDNRLTPEVASVVGENLGSELWKSREWVKQNKKGLESPSSIVEYEASFPPALLRFF